MATDLHLVNVDWLKALAVQHSTKLLGAAAGVSSVVVIGLAWSLLASLSPAPTLTCSPARKEGREAGGGGGGEGGGGTTCAGEGCPWQFVLSDLTNRLHLLEAAFKEQVLAREMMSQEVTNQSNSNVEIARRLVLFLRRLEEVERMVKRVETRMQELSARLYSDEFIGFVVIMAIMVEVLLRVRPRVGHLRPSNIVARYRRWSRGLDGLAEANSVSNPANISAATATTSSHNNSTATFAIISPTPPSGTPPALMTSSSTQAEPVTSAGSSAPSSASAGREEGQPSLGLIPNGTGSGSGNGAGSGNGTANGSVSQVLKPVHANGGMSFSPKHGLFLKAELCVIAFRRDSPGLAAFAETTLRHLEEARVSVRPYYLVEGHEHLKQCPRCRLYLVIFETEERLSQDCDLITSAVRYIKSLKAQQVLVVINDEGSKKLTGHVLYNAHLRLLQSHEAFQDLTSAGRVFSAWRELTSHQLSHMRKIVRTVLNLKVAANALR